MKLGRRQRRRNLNGSRSFSLLLPPGGGGTRSRTRRFRHGSRVQKGRRKKRGRTATIALGV